MTHRNGQSLGSVEHCLLPVSVLGVRTGRELDGLVAAREVDVEPTKESVNVVVTGSVKLEWNLKVEVLFGDRSEVDVPDGARSGSDGLEVDAVYQRFTECDLLDARVVKSINIVPDCRQLS